MTSQLILEHDFDHETLSELHALRAVRISMLRSQLEDLEKSAADLRPHLQADVDVNHEELSAELYQRIATLTSRLNDKKNIYADELEFFIGLLSH